MKPHPRFKKYIVIGLLKGHRWADTYWAHTVDEAEGLAFAGHGDDLQIAAVLHRGKVVS